MKDSGDYKTGKVKPDYKKIVYLCNGSPFPTDRLILMRAGRTTGGEADRKEEKRPVLCGTGTEKQAMEKCVSA